MPIEFVHSKFVPEQLGGHCPVCKIGQFQTTPTAGRYECSVCFSTLLSRARGGLVRPDAMEGEPPPLSPEDVEVDLKYWNERRIDQNWKGHPLCHCFYGTKTKQGPNVYTSYVCRFCQFTILWPEKS